MIVNTSPLLKGRSCSDVPLKLYLATHSVPCGHGVYGNKGRSLISKLMCHQACLALYPGSDTQNSLWYSGDLSYLDLCHGEVVQSSHR